MGGPVTQPGSRRQSPRNEPRRPGVRANIAGVLPSAVPRLPASAPIEAMLDALAEVGGVVIESLIEPKTLTPLRTSLRELVSAAALGDNEFDGFRTRRVFDPLARTRVLDHLVTHHLVHEIASAAIPWPYQFGMTVLSSIEPAERPQRLHRDAAVYPLPPGFPEVMVNTIWAIDEFTQDNGATRIALGSHRHRKEDPEIVPVPMPAGSVLLYVGRLLHGAGANDTDAPRLGLIVEHVARWLRPADTHVLTVNPQLVVTLSEQLRELLGYNQISPYVGLIAGLPPEVWLRRSGFL
jgi:hypothetical protein